MKCEKPLAQEDYDEKFEYAHPDMEDTGEQAFLISLFIWLIVIIGFYFYGVSVGKADARGNYIKGYIDGLTWTKDQISEVK